MKVLENAKKTIREVEISANVIRLLNIVFILKRLLLIIQSSTTFRVKICHGELSAEKLKVSSIRKLTTVNMDGNVSGLEFQKYSIRRVDIVFSGLYLVVQVIGLTGKNLSRKIYSMYINN